MEYTGRRDNDSITSTLYRWFLLALAVLATLYLGGGAYYNKNVVRAAALHPHAERWLALRGSHWGGIIACPPASARVQRY
jgi:hypothetical protein